MKNGASVPLCRMILTGVLLAGVCLAIDGTVINKTTNKPAVNATVTLYRLAQQTGMESVESVHTDAQGRFSINQDVPGGPRLLQSAFDGVTYNHMLPPGSPTTGLTLDVFNASKKQGDAKIAEHWLVLQPGASQMNVREMYVYRNAGNTAFNDPDGGTLKFYLPPAAKGVVQVNATAPQGMPIQRAAEKTAKPDVYRIDFPIKPGETRFELQYLVPYTSGSTFETKVIAKADSPVLVAAPGGVAVEGEGLSDKREQSGFSIWSVGGEDVKLKISGQASAAAADSDSGDSGGPSVDEIMPRVAAGRPYILALAFAILALGFALLYRRTQPAGKE